MDEIKGKDLTLFEPSSEDIRIDYPELAGYEEFRELSVREMRFCWYVGNRTSPIRTYSQQKRVRKAIDLAFSGVAKDKEEVQNMRDGKMPEHIVKAIQRMGTFNLTTRLKAKFADEYIFDMLQDLIVIGDTEKKGMDLDDKKKYADLVIKVSSEMPDMVKRMESGYGVKIKGKKKKGNEIVASVSDVQG